jgi:hypothetical protein
VIQDYDDYWAMKASSGELRNHPTSPGLQTTAMPPHPIVASISRSIASQILRNDITDPRNQFDEARFHKWTRY